MCQHSSDENQLSGSIYENERRIRFWIRCRKRGISVKDMVQYERRKGRKVSITRINTILIKRGIKSPLSKRGHNRRSKRRPRFQVQQEEKQWASLRLWDPWEVEVWWNLAQSHGMGPSAIAAYRRVPKGTVDMHLRSYQQRTQAASKQRRWENYVLSLYQDTTLTMNEVVAKAGVDPGQIQRLARHYGQDFRRQRNVPKKADIQVLVEELYLSPKATVKGVSKKLGFNPQAVYAFAPRYG